MSIQNKTNKHPSPSVLTAGLTLGLGVAVYALFQENVSFVADFAQDTYESIDWDNVGRRALTLPKRLAGGVAYAGITVGGFYALNAVAQLLLSDKSVKGSTLKL